jgi:alkanesulfonate monooxygenase SsuD/methylene tetrahydromethanopterin reductase-like flavin-dependent oxidoreductase (luciferase family)
MSRLSDLIGTVPVMRFGFVLPFSHPGQVAAAAAAAERAGWDGIYVYETIYGWDGWVSLAAAAVATSRIRLGTMLTPLSRRKPWELAGQALSVDHLSGGRVTLSVGLGAVETGFDKFGEETDRRRRAELLDEGLDIVTGLWAGQPYTHRGVHYTVEPNDFLPPPPPVQRPRIPIWVVGAWPRPKSMARALHYDGVLPNVFGPDGQPGDAGPDAIAEIAAYVAEHRPADAGPYDIVAEGATPADDPVRAAATARRWADAGATWWVEGLWSAQGAPDEIEQVTRRLAAGPPSS